MINKISQKKYIFFILHSILVLLSLSVYLNQYVSPKIFPYFGLIAIAFPILFFIHIIFTLIWLIKRKIVFLFFLFFTILFLFPLRKYVHFGREVKKEEKIFKNQIKILTYNVRYASGNKDLRPLEDLVIEQDVDVAFFQEIYRRQWRSKETFLAYRYNAVFDLVGISSKYPIIDQQKIILPGNGYACFADIQRGKDTIRCMNIYLEPMFLNKGILKIDKAEDAKQKTSLVVNKLTEGFKRHQVQIDLLVKYIQESPYPIIVCGDFNSVPLSYEYFTIKKGLTDAFEVSGRGLGMSFYDYTYPIRIDYVLSSFQFTPKDSHVDKTVKFSDHYPVFATLQLDSSYK